MCLKRNMEIWYTLTGNINPDTVGQAITWINSQIYNSVGLNSLKFLISSNGGDMDSAIRLYDYLKALPLEVTTIGFGQVDSAAITIYLAGNRRLAVKNCRFLIHEGTYTIGLPSAPLHIHQESVKFFEELLKRNLVIIADETTRKMSEIREIAKQAQPLTTEEAKKLGLVTEIIEKLPLNSQVPPPPQTV